MMFDFDVFVIGAGSGGVRAARMAAGERLLVGGPGTRGGGVLAGWGPSRGRRWGEHLADGARHVARVERLLQRLNLALHLGRDGGILDGAASLLSLPKGVPGGLVRRLELLALLLLHPGKLLRLVNLGQ